MTLDGLRRCTEPTKGSPPVTDQADDLREFLLILRRALLGIIAYIERKYGVTDRS